MLQFARSRAPFLAAALLQASARRAAGTALFQLRPLARLFAFRLLATCRKRRERRRAKRLAPSAKGHPATHA